MNRTIKAFAAAQRLIEAVECAGCNLNSYEDVRHITIHGCSFFPPFLYYEWGASRLVIWDDECDFVIKIALEECYEKYNKREVEIYEDSLDKELSDYFGWCKCYTEPTVDKPGIYVMEFLGGDEDEIVGDAYQCAYESYCERNGLDSSDFESAEEYDSIERDEKEEIMFFFESQMSDSERRDFEIFLSRWIINDLHSGNMLYRDNTLVICDYAGFGW